MRFGIVKAGQVLLLSLVLTGISQADDWTMSLTPQTTLATTNAPIDFQLTFVNNTAQDIFFSDFGDGQSISVDLEGNVVGDGSCAPGMDCFNQNLFLTSPDPIDIPAGSPGTTFDLGILTLGIHNIGDQITVVVKGGPDSNDGVFPDPYFSETSASVAITPEPSSMLLLLTGLLALGFLHISRTLRKPLSVPL